MRYAIATLSLALILSLGLSVDADARQHHKNKSVKTDAAVVALLRRVIAQNEKLAAQNEKLVNEIAGLQKHLQPDAKAAAVEEPVQLGTRNPALPAPMIPPLDKTLAGYEKHIAKSANLKDLTPGLATKVSEILRACNTKIASAYRRGARVAGSGRPSLHSLYPSQAADLVGDPKCIYAHLKKWPGGYSTDYDSVMCRTKAGWRHCPHVHVSLSSSGRERGARFVHHRGGNRYASRHARRSHRYAARREAYYEPSQMHYAVAR